MYVKTITAEGTIIGDPTSSIETLVLVFYSFLDLKSNFIRRTKRERETKQRDHNINQTFSGKI